VTCPLLRYQQFERRACGICAMLLQADRFLPAHNLQSPETWRRCCRSTILRRRPWEGPRRIRLEAAGANSTIPHYSTHASVGGKIAQVDSRLVDLAAQKMATEFFESFNVRVQERYGIAPVPAAPPPRLRARVVAWFKQFFGAATG